MDIGDFVYFWMAGGPEIRGIYGWGKILSKPYMKPDWDSHGVDVSCEYYFAKPVLAVDIESQTALKDMPIFRVRVGTNFRLDEKEARVLAAFISQKGQTAPRLT